MSKKILFVNACVRKNSRSRWLAEQVIRQLEGTVAEVNPAAATEPITTEEFISNRTRASEKGDFSDDYGYGYVKALAQGFYGIREVCQVKAEGLDMIGADVEEILNKALEGFRG